MCKKKQIEKAIPADEVIQALKCCASEEDNCHRCPFMGVGGISDICITAMSRAALDLICRKQSEGEWKIKSEIYQMSDDVDEELYVECPFCGRTFWVPYEFDDQKTFEYAREHYPYCNCGAKMKGGAE